MAKKQQVQVADMASPKSIGELLDETKFEGYGLELPFNRLTDSVVVNLALHGLKQKIGDAAAMTKAEKDKFVVKDEETGEEELDEDALADHIAEKRAKIVEQLLKGEWTQTGSRGPRAVGIDKFIRDVCDEYLRNSPAIKSGDRKWPSGKGSAELLAKWRDQVMAKYGVEVRNEAERRMKEAQFVIELDI